jgi:L-phenylalanine/L-methionine N-acetyltransferase
MTATMVVRAAEERDLAAITEIYNQRSVALGTLQIPFMTAAERQTRWITSDTFRPIVVEIDGQVVGHAGLMIYTRRRGHVGSIGMGVDERFQGRGAGTALMAALIDLADNWYNLHRLELEVYCDNAGAVHLYEKFGFVLEGTHRDYAFRDGRFVDAYSMARMRPRPADQH